MRILLLLLCGSFSGIFFIFSSFFTQQQTQSSLFSTPLIGGIVFLVLGIFLFFYFSKTKKIIYNEHTSESYLNIQEIQQIFRNFFSQYLYYIGVSFFYIALYLIFLGLGNTGYFSYFVFFLNVGVLFSLLFAYKFYIIQDILKINTIIFSLLYTGYYLFFLFFDVSLFVFIDFVNSLLIGVLFVLFLGLKDTDKKSYMNDPAIVGYFSFYSIVACIFYGSFFLASSLLASVIVTCLFGIFLFYIPQIFPFFQKSTTVLRTIGVASVCLSIALCIAYTLEYSLNFFMILFLGISIIFTHRIHILYQNYVSFFWSFLGIFFLFSYTYLSYFYIGDSKNTIFLINYLFISQMFIVYTYIYNFTYVYDVFSIHIFAYIINIFGVGIFFFFTGLDILSIGVILLFESLFIFSSYYKLNPLYKGQR